MSKFTKVLSSTAIVGVLTVFSNVAVAAEPSWAVGKQGTGNFDVTGAIDESCVISIDNLATVLNLADGETGASVATITESCNSGNGYTISFSSGSEGMVHSEDSELSVEYELNYDGEKMNDLKKDMTLTRTGEAYNAQYSVTIDVKGDDERIAGTYTDLIQVQIAAL